MCVWVSHGDYHWLEKNSKTNRKESKIGYDNRGQRSYFPTEGKTSTPRFLCSIFIKLWEPLYYYFASLPLFWPCLIAYLNDSLKYIKHWHFSLKHIYSIIRNKYLASTTRDLSVFYSNRFAYALKKDFICRFSATVLFL